MAALQVRAPAPADGRHHDALPSASEPRGSDEYEQGNIIHDWRLEQRFCVKQFLGKGGFARVYELMQTETGSIVAGKIISKAKLIRPKEKQKLVSEVKIHRSLNHKRVVKFLRFFEDEKNVYLLLQLCPNQSLMNLIQRRKRLPESETKLYFSQICEAVVHMHSLNIIHRDLKLANFLLDENNEIKVSDFGLAAKLNHPYERKKTICGTPNYIAPEILENGEDGHSFEVDVWSLGVVLYTLLIGKPPFVTKNVKATYRRIRENVYSFPPEKPISEEAKKCINWLLSKDPCLRPAAAEILSHPFFANSSDPSASADESSQPTTAGTQPQPQGLAAASGPAKVSRYSRDVAGAARENVHVNVATESEKAIVSVRHQGGRQEPEVAVSASPGNFRAQELEAPLNRLSELLRSVRESKSKREIATGEPALVEPHHLVQWWDVTQEKEEFVFQLSNGDVGLRTADDSVEPLTLLLNRDDKRVFVSKAGKVSEINPLKPPASVARSCRHLTFYDSRFSAQGLPSATRRTSSPIFLDRWLRTNHSMVFLVSCNVVQVNIYDHSKVIFDWENGTILYINKTRERSLLRSGDVSEEQNADLCRRLRYLRDLLEAMLKKEGSAEKSNAAQ